MAKETVIVGCRLPNGLILQHPKNPDQKVKLNGRYEPLTNSGVYLPPRPYGTTVVDAEFWAAWKEAYQGFPPLKNRAIFEAKSIPELDVKAREVEKQKTGFEAMPKTPVMDGMRLERTTI
ncbi:MAG: hypothetical protein ACYCOU_01850 [Sulfobacillus sp.]